MNERTPKGESPFCVVGIGASAGGLEAIQGLLAKLPDNTGMAFVIIQHLSPDYESKWKASCKIVSLSHKESVCSCRINLAPTKSHPEKSPAHFTGPGFFLLHRKR